MKIIETRPPRSFKVGKNDAIVLKDCGKVYLDADEQITMVTPDGKEMDVARKTWGFYATPSVNGRLKTFKFKTALVESMGSKYFILVVDITQVDAFKTYLKDEGMSLICWLDDDNVLATLKKALVK